jgi:hypothetical protein
MQDRGSSPGRLAPSSRLRFYLPLLFFFYLLLLFFFLKLKIVRGALEASWAAWGRGAPAPCPMLDLPPVDDKVAQLLCRTNSYTFYKGIVEIAR